MKASIVALALLVVVSSVSTVTYAATASSAGAEGEAEEAESSFSGEVDSLASESDVSSLETSTKGGEGILARLRQRRKAAAAAGVILGVALLAATLTRLIKRLPFLATTEESRAYALLRNNMLFAYAVLSEAYQIDQKLNDGDMWQIAKGDASYLLKAEDQVEAMVESGECLPGSIPFHQILEVIKEQMLRTNKMHLRVNTDLAGVLGLYVKDGRVVGLKDAVRYHIESFYETAQRVVKTIPLSPSQKAEILSGVSPIVERLPHYPKHEDLLNAQVEIGAFTRMYLTKGRFVAADGAGGSEAAGGGMPNIGHAELVFMEFFENYRASHQEADVRQVPKLIWRDMVKQFFTNASAQDLYETRCKRNGVPFVHITKQATANAIILRTVESKRLVVRRPVIPPPEASLLETE